MPSFEHASGSGAAAPDHTRNPSNDDRVSISAVVSGIGFYTDQCEWDGVEAGYADVVTADYVSLFGGHPETKPRSELIAGLRAVMPGFDMNQHLITTPDIRMDGPDQATSRSCVRATHRLGQDMLVFGGYYTHRLVRTSAGWQVTYVKFTLGYEEGDRALLARAVERVSQSGLAGHTEP